VSREAPRSLTDVLPPGQNHDGGPFVAPGMRTAAKENHEDAAPNSKTSWKQVSAQDSRNRWSHAGDRGLATSAASASAGFGAADSDFARRKEPDEIACTPCGRLRWATCLTVMVLNAGTERARATAAVAYCRPSRIHAARLIKA
jgi:hypothetical protein